MLLAGAALSSCAHAPPPCPTPEPVRVSIRASDRLNPGEGGESLATTLRLYQLKDVSKLQAASLEQILDNDRAVLGDDLVSVREITLYPGEAATPSLGRREGALLPRRGRVLSPSLGVAMAGCEQAGPAGCSVLPRARRRGRAGRAVSAALRACGQPRGIAVRAAMNVPHRVVWSEGMLVSPQHLQQADLYHERLLDRRLAALAPQTWGILSLELDLGALQAEQLRVSRFVGILPDGLYLDFAAGDPEAPAARPIAAHFPPAQPVLEVFLAVPKERDGVPSVAPEAAGGSRPRPGTGVQRTRFLAATRPVGDITGESADLAIAFCRRNISVRFGDEARDDFDTIKIAEIVRNASGALVGKRSLHPLGAVHLGLAVLAGQRAPAARAHDRQAAPAFRGAPAARRGDAWNSGRAM